MNLPAGLEPDDLAIRAAIRCPGPDVSGDRARRGHRPGPLLRHRAEARHGLWLGTLAWVLISPVVAALADRSGLAIAR